MALDRRRPRMTPRTSGWHAHAPRVTRGRGALAWATLLLLVASACASSGRDIPLGTADVDRALYDLGMEALKEGRWRPAREYFVTIVDNYPQSAYRADARLVIGDTYLGEGSIESYLMAITEFQEFLAFYPLHPRADYAQYQIGLVHYQQMRRAERDQTETRAAVTAFETFVERYPNSKLMNEARTKLREVRDRYSQSEFLVGRYYYRAGWYPGAIDRFKSILEDDPGFTLRDAVYFHLAESLVKSDNTVEALPYFARLVQEFEQSEYLTETQERIAELKEP